jgi:hypothetical protein
MTNDVDGERNMQKSSVRTRACAVASTAALSRADMPPSHSSATPSQEGDVRDLESRPRSTHRDRVASSDWMDTEATGDDGRFSTPLSLLLCAVASILERCATTKQRTRVVTRSKRQKVKNNEKQKGCGTCCSMRTRRPSCIGRGGGEGHVIVRTIHPNSEQRIDIDRHEGIDRPEFARRSGGERCDVWRRRRRRLGRAQHVPARWMIDDH